MATDITKSIESSLFDLQKHAKEQKAKIVDVNQFSEKVYVLMLEVLVEIENLHKNIYNQNSENELQHSYLTFHISNPNEDAESYSLIGLVDVENPPKNFNLSKFQEEFRLNYLNIIKECNANNKLQNFKISCMDTSTFHTRITMLIEKNTALTCRNDNKANGPNVIRIGLEIGE